MHEGNLQVVLLLPAGCLEMKASRKLSTDFSILADAKGEEILGHQFAQVLPSYLLILTNAFDSYIKYKFMEY